MPVTVRFADVGPEMVAVDPLTANDELRVVAPVTPSVLASVVAPVTPSASDRVVAPVTESVPEQLTGRERVIVPLQFRDRFPAELAQLIVARLALLPLHPNSTLQTEAL